MSNKIFFIFMSVFLLLTLANSACNNREELSIIGSPRELNLSNLPNSKPIDFTNLIFDVKYIVLQQRSEDSIMIDKIRFNDSFMYILDKKKALLYVNNLDGQKITEIRNVFAFNLYKDFLYTYEMPEAKISERSLSGKINHSRLIGFRGIDFVNLNDSTYVFHTAGLITDDRNSNEFELVYINSRGELLKMGLPISKSKQGVNYTATGRFSTDRDKIFFIPSLSNFSFQLLGEKIVPDLRFNFGEFELKDSLFSTFNNLEDLNIVPFILNITNKVNTPFYSFYSFTLHGTEGYFIIQKDNQSVMLAGMSAVASHSTDFNNPIPHAFYKDEFLSVLDSKEFMRNCKLSTSPRTKRFLESMETPDNPPQGPVLMLYKLKRP